MIKWLNVIGKDYSGFITILGILAGVLAVLFAYYTLSNDIKEFGIQLKISEEKDFNRMLSSINALNCELGVNTAIMEYYVNRKEDFFFQDENQSTIQIIKIAELQNSALNKVLEEDYIQGAEIEKVYLKNYLWGISMNYNNANGWLQINNQLIAKNDLESISKSQENLIKLFEFLIPVLEDGHGLLSGYNYDNTGKFISEDCYFVIGPDSFIYTRIPGNPGFHTLQILPT